MSSGFFAAAPEELPRRESPWDSSTAEQRQVPLPTARPGADDPSLSSMRGELSALQLRVPGVRGCVLAGVDGLLITHTLPAGPEPHDLAALAATTFGLGRQCGMALGQGPFRDSTIRSQGGYFTVYSAGDRALIAVLGDDGLNVARLHLEARPVTDRMAALLSGG